MPDSWVLRRATVADAPQLADLAAQTFSLACPPGFDARAIDVHIKARLSADAFRINLADVGLEYTIAVQSAGRAVGYLLLAATQPTAGVSDLPLLELRQIYVRQDLHGSGLADALMEVARARATDLGFAGLWLGTSKQNERAIRFYRRHGFRVGADRVFVVGDIPNEDWIMVRPARSGVEMDDG